MFYNNWIFSKQCKPMVWCFDYNFNKGVVDHNVSDITTALDSSKCYFETYPFKVQNSHWLIPILKSFEFEKNELLRIHNRYYYPFGSPMDGRKFYSEKYRFGFNGQEKDDEVAGAGNTNTALFWEYDTRLGRRWNIDPVVKPHESPYACFANNPIWNKDPNGDDFVNVHTERKEKAKEKRDKASVRLDDAKAGFAEFEGKTKKDAKSAGKLKEFKEARRELKSAQKSYNQAEDVYEQEVFFESVVNQVIEDFETVNPEKFAEWENFNPTGKGVLDIEISAQSFAIKILDKNGFPTGSTTGEGIDSHLRSANYKDDYVRVRLQVLRSGGVITIQAMTSLLVHALGHIDGGEDRDEKYANDYQDVNYDKIIKKKKKQ